MSPERTTQASAEWNWLLDIQKGRNLRLSDVFPKSGAGFPGDAKTLLDKPAVPPRRYRSVKGGARCATVFRQRSTKVAL
jgi:hypothetical protein